MRQIHGVPATKPGALPQNRSLLAIGDPESPGEEYPPLPNARNELDAIGALFAGPDKTVYEGVASRPSVYRESHPDRFSFVHFATHATVNPAQPLESALILSREGNTYSRTAREITSILLTPVS